MRLEFDPFPEMTTERLILRALEDGDEAGLFRLRADEETARVLCREPYKTVDEARARIAFLRRDAENGLSVTWALESREAPGFMGYICLWNFSEEENKAEIGYELLPEFRGKGYMLEAAMAVAAYGIHRMGLSKITACPPKNNPRSINLLESLGFLPAGERSETGQNGQVMDLMIYELEVRD